MTSQLPEKEKDTEINASINPELQTSHWSDRAYTVAEIDFFRLHKFEDLKKIRKELKDISEERKKELNQIISE